MVINKGQVVYVPGFPCPGEIKGQIFSLTCGSFHYQALVENIAVAENGTGPPNLVVVYLSCGYKQEIEGYYLEQKLLARILTETEAEDLRQELVGK